MPMVLSACLLYLLTYPTPWISTVTKVLTDSPELSAALNYDRLITYIELLTVIAMSSLLDTHWPSQ